MDNRKDSLLASAARLYSLGVDLETAREHLRQLAEQGISFDSDEMRQAYQRFSELDRQWKALEQQHVKLRDKLLQEEQED